MVVLTPGLVANGCTHPWFGGDGLERVLSDLQLSTEKHGRQGNKLLVMVIAGVTEKKEKYFVVSNLNGLCHEMDIFLKV